MNVLKCLVPVKWGVDRIILLRLNTSLVQSKIIDYVCHVCGLAKKMDFSSLGSIFSQGLLKTSDIYIYI